jgi:hypothetical protein
MSTIVSKTTHAICLIVILVSGFIGLTHPVSSYGKTYQNAICDDINLYQWYRSKTNPTTN